VKIDPSMAASIVIVASRITPSKRIALSIVVFFQWPCGV